MWIQNAPVVTYLAYAPDGRTLYALERTGALTAWDIAARASRKVVSISRWAIPIGCGIYPLADGQRIVSLDTFWATVFDTTTGREQGGVQRLTEHKSGLRDVTPEGRIFYLKTGAIAVAVWNLTTRDSEPARDIPKSGRRLRSFDVSKNEQSVALVGTKGAVTVYEWGAGPALQNPVAIAGVHTDARFSPDGQMLALFSENQIHLCATHAPTEPIAVADIDNRHGKATFAFHPRAPVFVALNRSKHLTLFSSETGAALRSFDFALGRNVTCVAFSPDGLTCAVGGSNKQFAVFDVDV